MAPEDFAVFRTNADIPPKWTVFSEPRQLLLPAEEFNRTIFASLDEAKTAIDTHNATVAATPDATWAEQNPPITYP
jgi:hypothetical protein